MNQVETSAEHIDPALNAVGWSVLKASRLKKMKPFLSLVIVLLSLPCAVVDAAPVTGGDSIWQTQRSAFAEFHYQSIERSLNDGPRHHPGAPSFILDERALILTTDKDPVDVQLRRTRALLDHLKLKLRAGCLAPLEAEISKIAADAQLARTASQRDKLHELFLRLLELTRQVSLSNPLLDFNDLLFMGHARPGGDVHMVDPYAGWNARPGGGLFVLRGFKGDAPCLVDLLEKSEPGNGRFKGKKLQGGAFLRPDLSSDAQKIAFAWNNISDKAYHIFTVDVDGSNLTQLTDGIINFNAPAFMDSSFNDFDPCWLPGGRVAFLSERRGGYLRCSGARPLMTYTLYSMKPDGSDIIPISYHETNEWNPSVDHSGRIVYTRWDYVDRDDCIAHHLWTCFPDGRDPRSPHGNYPLPWSYEDKDKRDGRRARPNGEWNIRAIPGSRKYVATAAGHHTYAFGELVVIDTDIPDDGAMSQVRGITVSRSDWPDAAGDYGTAWPLSEDFYLANFRDDIILLDRFGNRELLVPKAALPPGTDKLIHPIPLTARPKPPVIPTATYQGERASVNAPKTSISVMNVYEGDMKLPEGTKIHALRVIQIIPQLQPVMNQPKIGYASESLVRMPLGTVPVEQDGSVNFFAPAGKEFYFQLLNERGLAVRSMRSGTYLHAGESLSCTGCHESRNATPKAMTAVPIALRRAPSSLAPEVSSGAMPFNWHLLAKPVLQQKCAACHAKEATGPDMSYASLEKWVFHYPFTDHSYTNGDVTSSGSRTLPGKFGAMQSPLLSYLNPSHYKVSLTQDEFKRITLWLDCNGNELGAYTQVAEQQRGEIVWPEIDVDPQNPLGCNP
jgi:hypothetical protein